MDDFENFRPTQQSTLAWLAGAAGTIACQSASAQKARGDRKPCANAGWPYPPSKTQIMNVSPSGRGTQPDIQLLAVLRFCMQSYTFSGLQTPPEPQTTLIKAPNTVGERTRPLPAILLPAHDGFALRAYQSY